MATEAKCPFPHGGSPRRMNHDWWPNPEESEQRTVSGQFSIISGLMLL